MPAAVVGNGASGGPGYVKEADHKLFCVDQRLSLMREHSERAPSTLDARKRTT
jgi:hypothetical protein